jgi:putative nucleotidyltransferase with HDIG domain
MLTRLTLPQLRPGMHVHAPCGATSGCVHWPSAFTIDSPVALQRLHDARIDAVWVDVSRSDPASLAAGSRRPECNECDLVHAVTGLRPSRAASGSPSAFRHGLERARRAVHQARVAVAGLFREARDVDRIDPARVRAIVEALIAAVDRDPGAMLALARIKRVEEYTTMHSVAVAALMLRLADALGMDEADRTRAVTAGLLHDLGKVVVPPQILAKPGALDETEWRWIRRHPDAGGDLLARTAGIDPAVIDACRRHHERVDGRGYPEGLPGECLSLLARMIAVCDTYDAITSDRPYRVAAHPAQALRRMSTEHAGHFDDEVLRALVRTLGAYPDGSLVRLGSQRLAIVVAQHEVELRLPTVQVIWSIHANARIAPRNVELAEDGDTIVAEEDAVEWGLPPLETLLA